MNHTPAPWTVTPDDNEAGVYYVRAKETIFADADNANARLIEAAPLMFSALLECEALLLAHDYPVILRQVRAALAKAEGKP